MHYCIMDIFKQISAYPTIYAIYVFISIPCLLLAQHLSAQIKIDWAPREDLNILLPKSIRIMKATEH
jgi:hypothetical protein